MGSEADVEFGFVPSGVVSDLKDIGNWKVRADAIERLRQAAGTLQTVRVVLPYLPELLNFLMGLVMDPNFKISLTAMQILGQLIGKLGRAVQPHLATVMPVLVDKLSDNKIVVQQADVKVLQRMLSSLSAEVVLPHLAQAFHARHARAREEAACLVSYALLSTPQGLSDATDWDALVFALCLLVDDRESRVAGAALDAMALLQRRLGTSRLADAIHAAAPGAAVLHRVTARLADPALPALSPSGAVEGTYGRGSSRGTPDNGTAGLVPGILAATASASARQIAAERVAGEGAGSTAAAEGAAWGARTGRRGPASPPNPALGLATAPPGTAGVGTPRAGRRAGMATAGALMGAGAGAGAGGNPLLSPRMSPPRENARYLGAGVRDSLNETAGPHALQLPAPQWPAEEPQGPYSPTGMGDNYPSMNNTSYQHHADAVGSLPRLRANGGTATFTGTAPDPRTPRSLAATSSTQSVVRSLSDTARQDADALPAPPPAPPSPGPRSRSQPGLSLPPPDPPATAPHHPNPASLPPAPRLDIATPDTMGLEPGSPGPRSASAASSKLSILKERNAQWRARQQRPGGSVAASRGDDTGDLAAELAGAGVGARGGASSSAPPGDVGRARGGPGGPRPDPVRDMGLPPGVGGEEGAEARGGPRRDLLASLGRRNRGKGGEGDVAGEEVAGVAQTAGRVGRGGATGVGMGVDSPRRLAGGGSSGGESPRSRSSVGGSGTGGSGAGAVAEVGTADLTPLPSPESDLRRALAELEAAKVSGRKELDWVGQFDALNVVRRAVVHDPAVVAPHLRALSLALVPAVDSLRSLTAKTAMMAVQEMLISLGKAMDGELEHLVPVLLKRAGEVSVAGRENFLALEADAALSQAVARTSEGRSAAVLLAHLSHKNPAVRTKVAAKLDELLAAHGYRMLGNRPLLEAMVGAAVRLVGEAAQDTRTFAKRMLWEARRLLDASGGDFARVLGAKADARARELVLQMFAKEGGPPAAPRPTTRAVLTRNNSGGAGVGAGAGVAPSTAPAMVGEEGRGGRAVRRQPSRTGTRAGMGPTTPAPGMGVGLGGIASGGAGVGVAAPAVLSDPEEVGERMPAVLQQMGQRDFRDRIDGVKSLATLLIRHPRLSEPTVVTACEAMAARCQDGNTKVAAEALEALSGVLPSMRDGVGPGLGALVPALAACMGSTNERIRQAASTAMSTLTRHVDPGLLVQHVAHCVSHAGGRGKAPLVQALRGVAEGLDGKRPQLVVKYVVPAALTLLSDPKVDVKAANQDLLISLKRNLGDQVDQAGAGLSAAMRARLEAALEGVV